MSQYHETNNRTMEWLEILTVTMRNHVQEKLSAKLMYNFGEMECDCHLVEKKATKIYKNGPKVLYKT